MKDKNYLYFSKPLDPPDKFPDDLKSINLFHPKIAWFVMRVLSIVSKWKK